MATNPLQPDTVAPALQIPPGASVKVQIIDTTSRISNPASMFLEPPIKGHDSVTVPAFSFLIQHPSSGRKILFDAGVRKDWASSPPSVMEIIGRPGWTVNVEENVAEILQEGGIDVAGGAIEAVIWSHYHFDHTGDVSTFPTSTALITGPGVKDAFLPGFPVNQESPLLATDFEGREHTELDFDGRSTLNIGGFRALDFFGDGSFYLLDVPGHAIGHICGLARVTSTADGDAEDTFVFMGADAAHHGGEFRPSKYQALPDQISPSPYTSKYPSVCPGHIFEAIHPRKSKSEPFYILTDGGNHDKKQATESVSLMQEFDGVDNVFVVIAHDDTILDPTVGIEWFPQGTMKDWKVNRSAEKARWAFLKDFRHAVEV